MKEINGLTPVYLDIETAGFSAWEDEFICAAIRNSKLNRTTVFRTLFELMDSVGTVGFDKTDLLVTYNGENYRGGFDWPFLRSKCLQKNTDWKLGGVQHLDLLPLIRKYLNTTGYVTEIPSKSSLRAPDLKALAKVNNIDYQNRKQAYKEMKELGEVADWFADGTNYIEPEAKEDNSLQSVYQKLFDPEKEEKYISGEKVPELYKKYHKTGDVDCIEKIDDHCARDVERLKKVAEKVIPVLPDWEVKKNINKL